MLKKFTLVFFTVITMLTCGMVASAQVALTITNPAAVCNPGTVDITTLAVTAGSTLPGGTTLSYFDNAAATIILNNPNAINVAGIYYIKATDPGGVSDIKPVVVTINPIPAVTSVSTNTICNNTAQVYTITGNVGTTNFFWTRPVVTGISNPAGAGTNAAITETLVNTTSLPINVVYNITPQSPTCTGAIFTYTVTVNPTATIASSVTAAICNNTPQSYTILSATPLATFAWTRPVLAGISNSAGSGISATITETLVNTTISPIAVPYTITPQTAAGCIGTPFVYTVTVEPSPTLNIINPGPVCSPATVDIAAPSITSGSTGGTNFSYFTDAATTTPLPSPTAIATSGTYYIKYSAVTGCNQVKPVVVIINASIIPTFVPLVPICSGSVSPVLPASSTNVTPITGSWLPATVSNTATGTYIFTPTTGQCATITSIVQTIIAPGITPLFTALLPICKSSTAPTLPTTSTNAITGTWSPVIVSNLATGIYTFTPSAGQCATTTALTQIVRQPTTSTTNTSICPSSLPYIWNAVSYSTAGTYTATFTNSLGCDSVATLHLIVKGAATSTTTVSVCSSALPYTWNGTTYNSAGTYTGTTLTNSLGCDSIPTLILSVSATPSLIIQNPLAVCSPLTVDITNPSVMLNNSILPQGTVINYYEDAATNTPLAIPQSISAAGIYYIQATTPGGCKTNPVSVAVTINPSPSANAGTDKSTCNGNSIVIGSPQIPGFNYSWNPISALSNAAIAQPTVSGLISNTKYVLTVSTSFGCFAKDSVIVDLLPLHISLPDTIKQTCVGATVSIGLDAQPDCNYNWISSPAGFTSTLSNPSVVTPSILTSYYLTATDTVTGCHGSAYVTVAIDSCLAANSSPVLAYPNPANQYISIKFNQVETGPLCFQLINDKGQTVINNAITYSYPITISVAALPTGKYYYTIFNSSGIKLKSDRILIIR